MKPVEESLFRIIYNKLRKKKLGFFNVLKKLLSEVAAHFTSHIVDNK